MLFILFYFIEMEIVNGWTIEIAVPTFAQSYLGQGNYMEIKPINSSSTGTFGIYFFGETSTKWRMLHQVSEITSLRDFCKTNSPLSLLDSHYFI